MNSTNPAPARGHSTIRRRSFLRIVAHGAATVLVAAGASSCGTLLYPDRRGQPRGQLDLGVIALDAIGLIFFIVPGLIAFAVDFSTGAIYLPPPAYLPQASRRRSAPDLTRVEVAREELTRERIEAVVERHTGQPVTLETGRFRASPINDLAEFDDTAARLADPDESGPATHVRFL